MIYWLTTNLWTTGQGIVTRRLMPRPAPPPKRSSRTPPKEEDASADCRRVDDGSRDGLGHVAPRAQEEEGRATAAMSDNGTVRVEATGETVGEAKWAALRQLEQLVPGLDRESVEFQVVTEGERGLLGVGYTPAHVVAIAAAEAGRPARERRGRDGPRVRRARRVGDRRERDDVRRRARRRRHRDVLGAGPRAPDRKARPDDRRDPVPRERDRAHGRGVARGRRRRGRLSRAADGVARGRRPALGTTCRGDRRASISTR